MICTTVSVCCIFDGGFVRLYNIPFSQFFG